MMRRLGVGLGSPMGQMCTPDGDTVICPSALGIVTGERVSLTSDLYSVISGNGWRIENEYR